MKGAAIIFRIGAPVPISTEVELLRAIVSGPAAIGLPVSGFGFISIIETEQSPTEIARLYQEAAVKANDKIPVIVTEVENCAANFGDIPGFNAALAAFMEAVGNEYAAPAPEPEKPKQTCELTVDQLLDLINDRGGVDKLTEEETARLKELTN